MWIELHNGSQWYDKNAGHSRANWNVDVEFRIEWWPEWGSKQTFTLGDSFGLQVTPDFTIPWQCVFGRIYRIRPCFKCCARNHHPLLWMSAGLGMDTRLLERSGSLSVIRRKFEWLCIILKVGITDVRIVITISWLPVKQSNQQPTTFFAHFPSQQCILITIPCHLRWCLKMRFDPSLKDDLWSGLIRARHIILHPAALLQGKQVAS